MLKDLKMAELKEVADNFGVDYDGVRSKAALLSLLNEEGVTDALVDSFSNVEVPEPSVSLAKKPTAEPEVLVKMDRANYTYEIYGHLFTKEHPFVAMSSVDAQQIFDFDPRGFRIATPNEVKEFYS